MGAIGGLLGLNGGFNGTGAASPVSVPITPTTDQNQLYGSYQGAQGSLQSQAALLAALQGQNGIGNQSQVYNQIQGVAAGTGPNPAQAMLNQATGQNVANQAALMAGQRGASANPGLIARQIAQQGAGIQQNAIGQAATLQSQQQLGALGAAGNLANAQVGQQIGATGTNIQGQQSEQQILQNALAGMNSAAVGQQAGINSANAGLANSVIGEQTKAIGAAAKGVSAGTQMAQGGLIGPKSYLGKLHSGMAHGGNVGSKLKQGGSVPGKAVAAGNSYQNDKVKALLSPGEGVIDRETMMDKGPMGQSARALMAAIEAKKKGRA